MPPAQGRIQEAPLFLAKSMYNNLAIAVDPVVYAEIQSSVEVLQMFEFITVVRLIEYVRRYIPNYYVTFDAMQSLWLYQL